LNSYINLLKKNNMWLARLGPPFLLWGKNMEIVN